MDQLIPIYRTCPVPQKIFSYLDPKSLSNCRLVAFHWKECIDDQKYWYCLQLEDLEKKKVNFISTHNTKLKDLTLVQAFPEWKEVLLYFKSRVRLETLKLFLLHLKDYFQNGNTFVSPLHSAIKCDNLTFVHILLQSPLDFNTRDDEGWTPMHSACDNSNLEMMSLLLNNVQQKQIDFHALSNEVVTHKNETRIFGIKIHSSEETYIKRRSPFFHACANGLLDIVKLMIMGPTTVNAKCSESGRTALHVACFNGDVQLSDWLLSHPDIDVNARDNEGKTALHYLCKSDPNLQFLLPFESTPPEQVLKQKDQLQILQTLINNAKDLNLNFNVKTLDDERQTPYHGACEYGTYDVVKLLMENVDHCGIDINALNGYNQTGLDLTKHREKKYGRLIQGYGNDGILWKLRDFISTLYEHNPIYTIMLGLCLLLCVYSIVEEIWVWILNFTQECDRDCFSYTGRSLILGLELEHCICRNVCMRDEQFWIEK